MGGKIHSKTVTTSSPKTTAGQLSGIAIIAIVVVAILVSSSSDKQHSNNTPSASTASEQPEPGNYLDRLYSLQSEKATSDCTATRGPEDCGTPEGLEPFRRRLVLFLVADKEAWLSPNDVGFRSLQPDGKDAQQHRADILAELGDYSGMAIYLVQSHIKPTEYLWSIYPDLTAEKLFYENKVNSAVWSAVDHKHWCGDGCWMVWVWMKPDKNHRPVSGCWEVNLTTKRIKVVDETATPFFTATN